MGQTITIRIPEDMRKDLEELSKYEHKPVSDLVRDSLRRYISIHRFRKLRNITLPFAESSGIITDEDVFKIIS
ncbi:MAG: ribbon-helix-helix domain-containing protein [Spirochaetia bacterium]|nr:ribbon-helix-helix domain-containing protein [Spirochaetia bacterium]